MDHRNKESPSKLLFPEGNVCRRSVTPPGCLGIAFTNQSAKVARSLVTELAEWRTPITPPPRGADTRCLISVPTTSGYEISGRSVRENPRPPHTTSMPSNIQRQN